MRVQTWMKLGFQEVANDLQPSFFLAVFNFHQCWYSFQKSVREAHHDAWASGFNQTGIIFVEGTVYDQPFLVLFLEVPVLWTE